jgi:hypothetical protein
MTYDVLRMEECAVRACPVHGGALWMFNSGMSGTEHHVQPSYVRSSSSSEY